LEHFGVFIFMMSQGWGTLGDDGVLQQPTVEPAVWYAQTRLSDSDRDRALKFLRSLTMTRNEARAELEGTLRPDGLPHSPSLFVARPFIEIEAGVIVPASPSMVTEHLRGGLWKRLLDACKQKHSADVWFSAVGAGRPAVLGRLRRTPCTGRSRVIRYGAPVAESNPGQARAALQVVPPR